MLSILSLFLLLPLAVWCVYKIINGLRKSPITNANFVTEQKVATPGRTWRIVAYIALAPVVFLCVLVVSYFIVTIVIPCSGDAGSGFVCAGSGDFGDLIFGLGWIVGLFLIPLCLILAPLITGILFLFHPSNQKKRLGFVLLAICALLAWQYHMLWFPLVGILPEGAQTPEKEAAQRVWSESVTISDTACSQSANKIQESLLGMVRNPSSDLTVERWETKLVKIYNEPKCLLLTNLRYTNNQEKVQLDIIYDVGVVWFDNNMQAKASSEWRAFWESKEVPGKAATVKESGNWKELSKLFAQE